MSQINIGGLTIDKFYLGDSSDVKIYLGNVELYPQSTPPTPVSSCHEVIPQPFSQYASTTYDSVYSFSDAKWYVKNNLSQYEEYGIYDIVENISSATTYDGKLVIVGTTEYQYSGGSWSVVGTYEDASVTYTIDGTNPSPYVGQELATTFKIPYADVEALGGWLELIITTEDGGVLTIYTDVYGYYGSQDYEGTVTNDGEYYYFALPSEAPQSIIIKDIEYFNPTPIHLITGSKQVTVEYAEKVKPSSALTYSSVEEMEAASCPIVGVGQYCYTNGQTYKYTANEEWTTVQDSDLFVKHFYDDGRVGILPCVYSDTLNVGVLGNKSGTLPNTEPTIEVYVGDCVLHLGDDAFYGLKNMTSCRLPNNIDKIPSRCFYDCFSLTSITIPYSVTEISNDAFYSCSNLKNISIPSNVTSIGNRALRNCSGLTSITVEATTPPTLALYNVFDGTNNCPIYVPPQSVDAYKSATNWSTYASRIQAIPT